MGKWNVLFPGMQGEVRVHVGHSGRFGLVFAESVPGIVPLCVFIVPLCVFIVPLCSKLYVVNILGR